MTVIKKAYRRIAALIIANVIFGFLSIISTGNVLAQDLKGIEPEKAAIIKLISQGETDEALKEYEKLVMLSGKEDLSLLQNIISTMLKRKNPLTIAVLGNLRNKNAVPFVVEALLGSDNLVSKSAAEALRNLNDEKAIPPLIQVALCHSEPMVREATLETLNYFRSNGLLYRSHVPAILESLQNCIDIDVGGAPLSFAVKSLGELGDARAIPVLLELLEQVNNPIFLGNLDNEHLPEEIAGSLNKLGDYSARLSLVKLLDRGTEKERIKAVLALGSLGDRRVVPALIRILEDKNATDDVRVKAARALRSLGDREAGPVLRQVLKDKSGWVREQMAAALYGLGDRDIFPVIMQEIVASRTGIDSVIESLENNAAPFLIDVLNQEGLASALYIRAAGLLGETRDMRAVPVLIQILDDHKSIRRQAQKNAAISLGNLGDRQAVPALIHAAGVKDDMDLSKAALEALYKLGDRRAVSALVRDLEDEEGFYLRGDEIMMTFNSGQNLVTKVDKDIHRGEVATALGKLGDASAVPILVKCLADKRYYRSRLKIAAALGELRDKRAAPALLKVIEEKDKELSKEAAMALAKLGDERAIPLLIESFAIKTDDDDRMQMVRSISEFGHIAIPTLIDALEEKNNLIRTWSAQTIGEIYSRTAASLDDDLVKIKPSVAGKGPHLNTEAEALKDKSRDELNSILSSNNSGLPIHTSSLPLNMNDNTGLPKVQAALSAKNADMRLSATDTLVRMQDGAALPNLKERLKSEASLVESRASELKRLGDDSDTPNLKQMIGDLNPKMESNPMALVGNEAGLHEALKVLRKRLTDSLDNVQISSAEALCRIVSNAE